MLDTIGVSSVDELFVDVPISARRNAPIEGLSLHQSELSVERHLKSLAAKNLSAGTAPCFIGAGAYHHHIPATVDHLIQRSEFLTSYTPYQPEIAQGTLQVLFEFQTQVARLLGGLNGDYIANASLYDGSTATAEAVLMASRITRKKGAVLSGGLHPHYAQTVATLGNAVGMDILSCHADVNNETGVLDHITDETACVVVQTPNVFGTLAHLGKICEQCREKGVLVIVVVTEIISLGLFAAPGDFGADIIVAEGQSIGVPLSFGGPYVGLMAVKSGFVRQMPGRICGETVDAEGKKGYVLTLSTREQHIRRDKATSNICTNSGLCALAFSIHLTLLGQEGLKKLARLNFKAAHDLADKLGQKGFEILTPRFFNEFTVKTTKKADQLVESLADEGILGGVAYSRLAPEAGLDHALLVCATEMVTQDDMDRFVDALTKKDAL